MRGEIPSNGNVYICYYDATNGNLKLARSTDYGVAWTISTVDNYSNDVGNYCSIAVSGSCVYISYYDATAGILKMFAKEI